MASISVFLDKRKETKAGTFPIKFCISHRHQKAYINTGIRVTALQWSKGNIISHPHRVAYNNVIKVRLAELEKKLVELSTERNISSLTAIQVRDLLTEDTNMVKVPLFFEHYDRYTASKQNSNTSSNFTKTKRSIERFLETKGINPKNLTFSDITPIWLQEYDTFMREVRNNSCNARSLNLRNIRTIFNSCISNYIIKPDVYPFKAFKIKVEETIKRSFSQRDVNIILSSHGDCDQEEYALDIFKLSFFLIGMNLTDIYHLQKENIIYGRISYRRAKTNRLYDIRIEPEAQALIDKYATPENDSFLLSFHNKEEKNWQTFINKNVRNFCQRHIKNINVTSYWARHTWATIASELDIPKDIISASLGHGHKSVTDVYINYNTKKVDEANRKVIDYAMSNNPTA